MLTGARLMPPTMPRVMPQRRLIFSVTIHDDGIGIRAEDISQPAQRHIGLLSMRERAEAAGGWFKIGPATEQGTIVESGLPYGPNTATSDTEFARSSASVLSGKQ
jgi:nitrate/nitrite-specific signal transduction histidine kinase